MVPEGLRPWRVAREIIDWSNQGESIFTRKRPLAPKTLRRIAIGLIKYGLVDSLGNVNPFVVRMQGQSDANSVDDPLSTVTGTLKHYVLNPCMVKLRGNNTATDIDLPLDTITAGGLHHALMQAFLMATDQTGRQIDTTYSPDEPVRTIVTKANQAVAQVKLTQIPNHARKPKHPSGVGAADSQPTPAGTSETGKCEEGANLGGSCRDHRHDGVDQPGHEMRPRKDDLSQGLEAPAGASSQGSFDEDELLPKTTLAGLPTSRFPRRLVRDSQGEPSLADSLGYSGGRDPGDPEGLGSDGYPVREGERAEVVIEPFIPGTKHAEDDGRARGILEPLTAYAGQLGFRPYLICYYSSGSEGQTIEEPLRVVTAKSRHCVIYPVLERCGVYYRLDIRFRMMTTRELARAQGFPDTYQFPGTQAQAVRAIGNSVSRGIAMALCLAATTQNPDITHYVDQYEKVSEEN